MRWRPAASGRDGEAEIDRRMEEALEATRRARSFAGLDEKEPHRVPVLGIARLAGDRTVDAPGLAPPLHVWIDLRRQEPAMGLAKHLLLLGEVPSEHFLPPPGLRARGPRAVARPADAA